MAKHISLEKAVSSVFTAAIEALTAYAGGEKAILGWLDEHDLVVDKKTYDRWLEGFPAKELNVSKVFSIVYSIDTDQIEDQALQQQLREVQNSIDVGDKIIEKNRFIISRLQGLISERKADIKDLKGSLDAAGRLAVAGIYRNREDLLSDRLQAAITATEVWLESTTTPGFLSAFCLAQLEAMENEGGRDREAEAAAFAELRQEVANVFANWVPFSNPRMR